MSRVAILISSNKTGQHDDTPCNMKQYKCLPYCLHNEDRPLAVYNHLCLITVYQKTGWFSLDARACSTLFFSHENFHTWFINRLKWWNHLNLVFWMYSFHEQLSNKWHIIWKHTVLFFYFAFWLLTWKFLPPYNLLDREFNLHVEPRMNEKARSDKFLCVRNRFWDLRLKLKLNVKPACLLLHAHQRTWSNLCLLLW